MFEQWKKAWREAVANFWQELDAEDGSVTDRLAAMRRDLHAVVREVERVEVELSRARADLAREREAEQSCRRREGLARGIGDDETARIAADYAARHAARAAVLDRKVRAIEAELELRRSDAREMEAALRALEAETAAAGGPIGATSPADPLTGEDDARDRGFRRMERAAREREAERRLEELKRKVR